MRVLKTTPSALLINPNSCIEPHPVFPIGLAFLQQSLQNQGIHVDIWDRLVDSEQALVDYINQGSHTLIGISIRNIDNVSMESPEDFIERMKTSLVPIFNNCQIPIVLGGAGFSIFPEELLRELGATYGLTGEGEHSLPLLINALHQGNTLDSIPGLWINQETHTLRTQPSYMNGGEIPTCFPDPVWLQKYKELGGIANVQTQRGCALNCCYCTYPVIEGKCYRLREPQDVAQELDHLEKHGVKYAFFVDSVFNTKTDHVQRVCEAILKRNLSIEWGCFLRPRNLDKPLLELMVQAGLTHIEFGTDSFSDPVLQSYGKSFRFNDIQNANSVCREVKVNHCHFLILGGPGETQDTLEETISHSRLLGDPIIFAVAGMRIYPNTPLHSLLSKKIKLPEQLRKPEFYLSEDFSLNSIQTLIQNKTRSLPNWIMGDLPEEFANVAKRLRNKGVQGPLWEYLNVMRRMSHNPS